MLTKDEKKILIQLKSGYEIVTESLIFGYENINKRFVIIDKKTGSIKEYKNFKELLKIMKGGDKC